MFENLRYYIPSFILLSMALFFFSFPIVAMVFVVAALLLAATVYALSVHSLLKLRPQQASYHPGATYENNAQGNWERSRWEEPTFKNVTIRVVRTMPGR